MENKLLHDQPCENQIVDDHKIRCRLISENGYECPFASQGWTIREYDNDVDSAKLRRWMCARYRPAIAVNTFLNEAQAMAHIATPNPGLKSQVSRASSSHMAIYPVPGSIWRNKRQNVDVVVIGFRHSEIKHNNGYTHTEKVVDHVGLGCAWITESLESFLSDYEPAPACSPAHLDDGAQSP